MKLPHVYALIATLLLATLHGKSPAVGVQKDIEYGRAAGQKLLLDIYTQKKEVSSEGGRLKPAVICIHGGGWEYGNKKDFTSISRKFAKHGYVVFSVNYRLSKGGRHVWPAQLDDVQRAVRWVRYRAGKYGVDPQRIVAFGASAGAHLSSLLGNLDTRDNSDPVLSDYSSRVNLVIDLAGPANLTKDFRSLKYYGKRNCQDVVDQFLGKPYGENQHLARAASPIFQISKSTVPHLIVHGVKDKVVPVDQARAYHRALKNAGISSTYVELPDAGHNIKNPLTLWLVFHKIHRFLEESLKPE